jgi:hypothetical protein
MLHSDILPEQGCDGELIEVPERCTPKVTFSRCAKCWTEFMYVPDDSKWVTVVYPGMKGSMNWPT